ncbi:hypothetical protein BOTBODRAFT_142481 [Botryobasidium botryosum FD-172 SS1]|uniref:SAPS-domain-containing protein n=1 Tax=Botryobasidium botryosum (strain FD-172 SS1) TaxID=930990 RepID=A0A067N7K8_BOTB1|nr:hypothetical protein BOTBODRAFT_142481 [Botryobasidium botryosum FD-172 SS1]
MFWRFSFANTSTIDSLLDRDDVALESILDEDDLLQECKSQNTRLIDYFQRIDVLHRLLSYVTGEIEGEDKGRFKYPYVATEVLCSEIWSIVETCVNNAEQLLEPFWETVLNSSPEEMSGKSVMAGHFSKVNAVFMSKKPEEMFAFIKSQPSVIERLINHIQSPAIVDLLFRIIQLEDHLGGQVIDWLSSENLIPRLVTLLSPAHSSDMHNTVSELVKGIIGLSGPSPGNFTPNGGDIHNGPSFNRFALVLCQEKNVLTLLGYVLDELPLETSPTSTNDRPAASEPTQNEDSAMDAVQSNTATPTNQSPSSSTRHSGPTVEAATSSLTHTISVLIELMRKNNSDLFEPYLFHTLRNRLIQIQQQQPYYPRMNDSEEEAARCMEEQRQALEGAMAEMVDQMGIVHLGTLLNALSSRLGDFEKLLRKPRSLNGPIATTIGPILPLTHERYRICELYSELLHCSNMSLLNRPPGYGPTYDSEGRLQGGLAALEDLARVIASASNEEQDASAYRSHSLDPSSPTGSRELPVSVDSTDCSSIVSDSESDDSSSLDDQLDDIEIDHSPDSAHLYSETHAGSNDPPAPTPAPAPIPEQTSPLIPSPPHTAANDPEVSHPSESINPFDDSNLIPTSPPVDTPMANNTSNDPRVGPDTSNPSRSHEPPPGLSPGDHFKWRLLDFNVLSTLLDLFFEFPWNSFLHNVVYDFVHQVITGRVDRGMNRDLIIALFRDARLMHRIIEAQHRNDISSAGPKGVRIGYMGHLTLISEDIVNAFAHYPPELTSILSEFAPQPEWDEYIDGKYQETKKKDTSQLGGGKPAVMLGGGALHRMPSRVDEEDRATFGARVGAKVAEAKAKVRDKENGLREDSIAGEGEASGSSSSDQFARYLVQQINSSNDRFSSSSDGSDDEDDAGWLGESHYSSGDFDLAALASGRRQLSSNLDDAFEPGTGRVNFADAFNADSDEDDGFGPFTDPARPADFSTNFASNFDFHGPTPFSFDVAADDDDGFGEFQGAELEVIALNEGEEGNGDAGEKSGGIGVKEVSTSAGIEGSGAGAPAADLG